MSRVENVGGGEKSEWCVVDEVEKGRGGRKEDEIMIVMIVLGCGRCHYIILYCSANAPLDSSA